jgi:cytoskeletal protein CcmA (bactofilin family)
MKKLVGKVLIHNSDIQEATEFIAQSVVEMNGNAADDIVIKAPTAIVRGNITGNLTFIGQVLKIDENAKIEKDVHATAKAVVILGQVNGRIDGTIQTLDDRSRHRS